MAELRDFLPDDHPIWQLLAQYLVPPDSSPNSTMEPWSEQTAQGSLRNYTDVMDSQGNFSRARRYFLKSATFIYFLASPVFEPESESFLSNWTSTGESSGDGTLDGVDDLFDFEISEMGSGDGSGSGDVFDSVDGASD